MQHKTRHDAPDGATHHGPPTAAPSSNGKEDLRDLGFGSRVSDLSKLRLLNRDGTFNVDRAGLSFFESINAYHSLLNMSWTRFYVSVFVLYIVTNVLFALLFLACGPGALNGVESADVGDRLVRYFFFSVQTFTTVGYGHISPRTLSANLLVMIETFVGLFAFALSTGLLFARFSRPTAKIMYSRNALIAPYRGHTAFEFRIANLRKSQMIEVEVRVMASWLDDGGDKRTRHYRMLELERNKVAFFPLHWTIVHPIDEKSPLTEFSLERMRATEMEFLVLITGVDDTFSQMVHSRMSYRYDEVVWGAKFTDIFYLDEEHGMLAVDLKGLHGYESASL